MTRPLPTGQELAVLRFVAEHGPLSAGRVAEVFGAEHGLARSTVLTVMERLRKKGHLSRRRSGGVYVYASALDRPSVLSRAVGQFIDRALQGSVSPIAAYLTERGRVSDEELRELEAAVRALRPKKKGDRSMSPATLAVSMLRTSIEGGVLILLVAAITRALPRLPAAARCAMWWLACLRLMIGLVVPVALPVSLPHAWTQHPSVAKLRDASSAVWRPVDRASAALQAANRAGLVTVRRRLESRTRRRPARPVGSRRPRGARGVGDGRAGGAAAPRA